ncbi:MAG: hypothetical protein C5B49_08180 [Bdellovibrio sp.]|nr:MAG: hypothetical protein C5B49_08180 [Bdellovibrio sp.]
MAVYVQALEGPHKGEKFLLKEGYEIGRARGEVMLRRDGKVSSRHALVKRTRSGNLVLVDQESQNGIKVNGQKVRRVTLGIGRVFVIGQTVFKVLQSEDEQAAQFDQPLWKKIIKEEVLRLIEASKHQPPEQGHVVPFEPAVEIRILEGIQADRNFILGFGPREFGSDTLDFELEELTAPPVAFALVPTEAGADFQTDYPDIVRLNDHPIRIHRVKEGDRVRIGKTLIEIGFVK